ncbi:MAG: adenosylcobalamin-dependent ribonucleoside-diphosphate reductase [Negativicutes bacterium]|nr:adenosylcobalamin-dependent ribonucleoside-diphosphate reductase [Negativicutes bacterium]
MTFSAEAMAVLKARYLGPDETPDGMFQRVARHVAQARLEYNQDSQAAEEEYYNLMRQLIFLPNSPALMNAGRNRGQLAACFVLPVEDSLEAIFDTLKHAALIHQSGGGTGFSFSRIRPRGDVIAATGGEASGPVSFLTIFDTATEVVKQGAVRRGANMAVLRVDHPDIEEFINAKSRPDALNNFNLSVAVTDQFMKAVENNTDFPLVNPRNKAVVKQVKAKQLFKLLTQRAWENGEPGLFFLDTVNSANPTPGLGAFEAPNPCSEQPLLQYESCVLGSINLTKTIKERAGTREVDYDKLRQAVRSAVRFLDDVITVNRYPLPAVAAATRLTRKIGLGIMGLADLFILLDIPYASRQAVELTAAIMRFITSEARNMSWELAVERGAFPAFVGSVYDCRGTGLMRNATVTTIAPTGSISIIAGCSSGIEPLFALAMTRRVLDGRNLTSINKGVLAYLDNKKLLTAAIEAEICQDGTVRNVALPREVQQVLATAHEIAPEWHVAHLAAAQRYTDNGVSKTVNLPNHASLEEVSQVFLHAYRAGCKGVTIYRDGSRAEQVLSHGVSECGGACDN